MNAKIRTNARFRLVSNAINAYCPASREPNETSSSKELAVAMDFAGGAFRDADVPGRPG
jgi:hypothetical protein